MLGTEKYSTSLSPVSSRSLEGEATSTTMSGASRIVEVEIRGYAALDGGIGLPRVIVVDDHRHPVREHGARQTCTRNGVAECSHDRQLDELCLARSGAIATTSPRTSS